jgi:uncharacterized protein
MMHDQLDRVAELSDSPLMNLSEEITRLSSLHQAGALSDAEFSAAKERLLNGSPPPPPVNSFTPSTPVATVPLTEAQGRTWTMCLHLSLLAGFIVPLAGFVAPIILWQMKKDEIPGFDAHGKQVINWLISHLIYMACAFVLCFVFIGIPLMFALGLVGIIFPIIGGIKANEGVLWRYPFCLTFLH